MIPLPRSTKLFLSHVHPIHPYYAAVVADAAFDEAIAAYCRPGANRWNLFPEEKGHPAIAAAYDLKVSADWRVHLMFQPNDKGQP